MFSSYCEPSSAVAFMYPKTPRTFFQIEECVLEYSFWEPVDWVMLPGDNFWLLEKIHGELLRCWEVWRRTTCWTCLTVGSEMTMPQKLSQSGEFLHWRQASFKVWSFPQAPTQPAPLPKKIPKSHPHSVLGSELQLFHLVPLPSWWWKTRHSRGGNCLAEAAQGKGNNLLLLRMCLSSGILQHILPKQTLVCLVVESTLSGDRGRAPGVKRRLKIGT